MESELIDEFEGKNTACRVLFGGKIETNSQGTRRILEIETVVSTVVGT